MQEVEDEVLRRFTLIEGALHQRVQIKGKDPSKPVGYDDGYGYLRVMVNGKKVQCHRIIWFLENGEWPDCLDHINGDKQDNRVENLRSITRRMNVRAYNKPTKGAVSSYRGVTRNGKGWRARVGQVHIGTYKCPTTAAVAYDTAALSAGYLPEACNFKVDEDKDKRGRETK